MPVMLVIVTRNNFCYSNRASYTANWASEAGSARPAIIVL
jgi:hypothetical protein